MTPNPARPTVYLCVLQTKWSLRFRRHSRKHVRTQLLPIFAHHKFECSPPATRWCCLHNLFMRVSFCLDQSSRAEQRRTGRVLVVASRRRVDRRSALSDCSNMDHRPPRGERPHAEIIISGGYCLLRCVCACGADYLHEVCKQFYLYMCTIVHSRHRHITHAPRTHCRVQTDQANWKRVYLKRTEAHADGLAHTHIIHFGSEVCLYVEPPSVLIEYYYHHHPDSTSSCVASDEPTSVPRPDPMRL